MSDLWEFYPKNEGNANIHAICYHDGVYLAAHPGIVDYISNEMKVDGDVWAVAYPKAGTTWLTRIATAIVFANDLSKAPHSFSVEVVAMGAHTVEQRKKWIVEMPKPRLFNSHLNFRFLPPKMRAPDGDNEAKVIYCYRNPKDVCVSLFHFHRMNAQMGNYTGSFEEFAERFMAGSVIYGNYLQHLKNYWKNRASGRIYIVSYERLLKDFINEVNKMSKFLGKELTKGQLQHAEKWCAFDKMKKDFAPIMEKAPVFNEKISPFFRKGVAGDWKRHFTVALNERFDAWIARELFADCSDFPPFEFE